MKVKELIKTLQELDGETLVVLSSDGEGNTYSPADSVYQGHYVAESTWGGQLVEIELTPELEEDGYDEDDIYDGPDAEPCVVIWPVN